MLTTQELKDEIDTHPEFTTFELMHSITQLWLIGEITNLTYDTIIPYIKRRENNDKNKKDSI